MSDLGIQSFVLRPLIHRILHQPPIQPSVFQGFLPGWLQPDAFDHLPIAEIDIGLGSLAALLEKISQLSVKSIQPTLPLHTNSIGWIAEENMVFEVFDL